MKIVVGENIINYLDIGEPHRKVLVFLHGWKDDLNTFIKLNNFLKQDFRLVLIDLPG